MNTTPESSDPNPYIALLQKDNDVEILLSEDNIYRKKKEEALNRLLVAAEKGFQSHLAEELRLENALANVRYHLEALVFELDWHKANAGLVLRGMGEHNLELARSTISQMKERTQ